MTVAGAGHALKEALTAALSAYGRGALDEASSWLDAASRGGREHPDVLHLRGLVALARHEVAIAVGWMERAVRTAPRVASYWNNLGVARRQAGSLDLAAQAHARAIALAPGYASAHNNLGAVLAEREDYERAAACFARAIQLGAGDADTHENHAKSLFCRGAFARGWASYRFRSGRALAVPTMRWQAGAPGTPVLLRREQGIGDQLFFLRFAPLAGAQGMDLHVEADPRLASMLERVGLHGPREAVDLQAAMGDLPWLLGMGDGDVVAPLALNVLADRAARVGAVLGELPRPWLGVTWRAGGLMLGRDTTKEISLAALGGLLGSFGGSIVSVQRIPRGGEHRALEAALGRKVLDLSSWNDDLESMLAVMAALDFYVGVSNANVHLRCGAGRGSDVLVPFPMDWRWRKAADGSVPWYPRSRAYHQLRGGDWTGALAALGTSLAERCR